MCCWCLYYWNAAVYFITKARTNRDERVTCDNKWPKQNQVRSKSKKKTKTYISISNDGTQITKKKNKQSTRSCTSSLSALFEFNTFTWLDWIYFVTKSESHPCPCVSGTFCHFFSLAGNVLLLLSLPLFSTLFD